MRVVVEYIYDTQKILVRLLEDLSPVQLGTYTINAFPQIQNLVSFDIESDQIAEGEAKVYLSGWHQLPDQVSVTLPDASVLVVILNKVLIPPKEQVTIEQPLSTIEKNIAIPLNYPAHAEFKPDEMKQPELPSFWLEFSTARADALKLGNGVSSDILNYTGGVAGRVLDTKIVQEAANQPPYKIGAPTRLEASFTNVLPNSEFQNVYVPPGFLDNFPAGWNITLSDNDNWIRSKVNFDPTVKLPHVEVTWYQRPGFIDLTANPPVTISTTPVPAGHIFQVLAMPNKGNATSLISLESSTGLFSTLPVPFNSTVILRLDVSTDPGPVKIVWNQTDPESSAQIMTLYGAMATQYLTPHSFIPEGATNAADLLTANNIGGVKWQFSEGYMRLDSEQELLGQPLSWTLAFSSGPVFLEIDGGTLASAFSSSLPLAITPYLPVNLETTGSYKLRWRWGEQLRLYTKLPAVPEQETLLPFLMDIPIPESLLTGTMDLSFKSYTTLAGSSRIKYFIFKPKERAQ